MRGFSTGFRTRSADVQDEDGAGITIPVTACNVRKANRVGLLSQETRPCPKQGGLEIPLRQLREFSHPETTSCLVFNLAPVFIS